jgi:alpha,alpha-trehalose phosphorylase (configuration-retaining)
MKPALYIGVSFDASHYGIYLHDGFYAVDYITESFFSLESLVELIYALVQNMSEQWKIILVAVDKRVSNVFENVASQLWKDFDCLGMIIDLYNCDGKNGKSVEEMACTLVRQGQYRMASGTFISTITNVNVGARNRVEVDADSSIKLATLIDYDPFISICVRKEIDELITWAKKCHLKVAFISSTPRGGGVALMRHALVRYMQLNGLHVNWYVMRPDPQVFETTKRKFHNVLQGVSQSRDYELSDHDKNNYLRWCEANVRKNWWNLHCDVFVLDDPQVIGCVNLLKHRNPCAHFVYRNHIHMNVELINDKTTLAHETFTWLMQFIQQCDTIVSHPIVIPKALEEAGRNHIKMTAVTDPIDGLNKAISKLDSEWYYSAIKRLCEEQETSVPPKNIPWIVQIARFDPSKGIEDVLQAFAITIKSQQCHLILSGHGSVDDPEGLAVYKETLRATISLGIQDHVTLLRCPPSDQLLNYLLSNAYLALQLSLREGFEVKVTESICKGVPVIAYATGGIPLQIKEECTGVLIKPRNVNLVAQKMIEFLSDTNLRQRYSDACLNHKYDGATHFFTPYNAYAWLKLFKTCL